MRVTQDAIAHSSQLIESWLPGALYPAEIAWFLENFASSSADVLLECGRQDGVSTEAFAKYLKDSPVELVSVDFDRVPARAQQARQRLRDYRVELVAGDIHVEVPKILKRYANKKVAVLQDGPKGWEGLATLLAAALSDNVVMVAQHNLHEGHVTRSVFQLLSLRPSFLEHSAEPQRFAELSARQRELIASKSPNRPLDHSSLGVMLTDAPQKRLIAESFRLLAPLYGPWNPERVAAAWQRGAFDFVPRLARRTRFSLARFKAR